MSRAQDSQLFPVREEPHEPGALNRNFELLLIFERDTGVVALADIAEVIDEGLERRIVLVVDVARIFLREGADFLGEGATFLSHKQRGEEGKTNTCVRSSDLHRK